MNEAARQIADGEIESLQDFLDDKRGAQKHYQDEADKEAAKIVELEAELAELKAQGESA
jgi:peptidoglycan hydrolase CwlO-like protein